MERKLSDYLTPSPKKRLLQAMVEEEVLGEFRSIVYAKKLRYGKALNVALKLFIELAKKQNEV